jgi:hypothetical protein
LQSLRPVGRVAELGSLDHMSRVELLTIKDCFLIEGRGVVVIPDFSVPDGWKDRTDTVAVTKPDGQQYQATAQFNMSHFRMLDPKASGWRVVMLLPNGKKEDLPVGSKILVSQEIRDAILPHNVA